MTLAELRDKVLQRLGVLAAGEIASQEDAALTESALRGVQGELEQLNIALWTLDDVPDYAAGAVIRMALPEVGPSFGVVAINGLPLNEGYRELAIRRLRELTADRAPSAPGTAEYF